jgi:hypothetical protein
LDFLPGKQQPVKNNISAFESERSCDSKTNVIRKAKENSIKPEVLTSGALNLGQRHPS